MEDVRVTQCWHQPETLPKSLDPCTSDETTDQEFRAAKRADCSHVLHKDILVNNDLIYHDGPIRL